MRARARPGFPAPARRHFSRPLTGYVKNWRRHGAGYAVPSGIDILAKRQRNVKSKNVAGCHWPILEHGLALHCFLSDWINKIFGISIPHNPVQTTSAPCLSALKKTSKVKWRSEKVGVFRRDQQDFQDFINPVPKHGRLRVAP